MTKRSPYARKVRIIALEKGIKMDLVDEDLKHKSKLLLDSNPIGRIPTLILDDGRTLCDSSVICEYLESVKECPRFYPKDADQRLEVLNLDLIAKSLTEVTVAIFYEHLRHPENPHQNFLNAQQETILRTLRYLEKNLKHLNELSVASVSAACAIGYLKFRQPRIWDKAQCRQLSQWHDDLLKRPSFSQTVPIE